MRFYSPIVMAGAVTEYLEGGTMQALLDGGLMAKTGHPLSLYVRMKIARDIVKGYEPMTSRMRSSSSA